MQLEQAGYQVYSALGLKEAIANCKNGGSFDLLILGHSIPVGDKKDVIAAFRGSQTSPILSLWARDEEVADSVDYLAFSDAPGKLLKSVASIMDRIASI
jgi:DNA-binding response OmpR family regulator